jgi:hypothetical protein
MDKENDNILTLHRSALVGLFAALFLFTSVWWPKNIAEMVKTHGIEISSSIKEQSPAIKSVRLFYSWNVASNSYVIRVSADSASVDEADLRGAYFNAIRSKPSLWIYSHINDPVFRVNRK